MKSLRSMSCLSTPRSCKTFVKEPINSFLQVYCTILRSRVSVKLSHSMFEQALRLSSSCPTVYCGHPLSFESLIRPTSPPKHPVSNTASANGTKRKTRILTPIPCGLNPAREQKKGRRIGPQRNTRNALHRPAVMTRQRRARLLDSAASGRKRLVARKARARVRTRSDLCFCGGAFAMEYLFGQHRANRVSPGGRTLAAAVPSTGTGAHTA